MYGQMNDMTYMYMFVNMNGEGAGCVPGLPGLSVIENLTPGINIKVLVWFIRQ